MYELKDLITDPSSPSAYFQNFEKNLQESPHHVLQIYLRWEKEMQGLDDDAWRFLRNEASPLVMWKDPRGRGWEPLFNILNQARAYNYLNRMGCASVRFIPRSRARTPDLEAVLNAQVVLCEVKSINISADELRARREPIVREIAMQLGPGFFKKLRSDIEQAETQLSTYNNSGLARRIVYFNLQFDDFLAEFKKTYFRQIDEFLLPNPVPGIELVFHNEHTPFHYSMSMRAAIVDNEA